MAELQYYGTGRRKTAVARVYLRPGKGDIVVNRRTFDEYFPNRVLKMIIRQPLMLTETNDKFDILVNVNGGGATGAATGGVGDGGCPTGSTYPSSRCKPPTSRAIRLYRPIATTPMRVRNRAA